MITRSIEIIMVGVGFLVGIFSGMEMNRAAQRFALEWRTTRRPATTAQERRRSALILVLAVLFGVVVLPRLPASFSTLLFLPFAAGLALTVLVSLAQKFLPLRGQHIETCLLYAQRFVNRRRPKCCTLSYECMLLRVKSRV